MIKLIRFRQSDYYDRFKALIKNWPIQDRNTWLKFMGVPRKSRIAQFQKNGRDAKYKAHIQRILQSHDRQFQARQFPKPIIIKSLQPDNPTRLDNIFLNPKEPFQQNYDAMVTLITAKFSQYPVRIKNAIHLALCAKELSVINRLEIKTVIDKPNTHLFTFLNAFTGSGESGYEYVFKFKSELVVTQLLQVLHQSFQKMKQNDILTLKMANFYCKVSQLIQLQLPLQLALKAIQKLKSIESMVFEQSKPMAFVIYTLMHQHQLYTFDDYMVSTVIKQYLQQRSLTVNEKKLVLKIGRDIMIQSDLAQKLNILSGQVKAQQEMINRPFL